MNRKPDRLRSAIFAFSTSAVMLAASTLAPSILTAQQAPASSAAEPAKAAAPAATVEPIKQTEPPKPIEKVSEDKPVEVKPTPPNKPTPDTTSPTAPSTSKVQPNGVETVAPGPSPIAAPGTLSAPLPSTTTPGGVMAQPTPRDDRYFLLVFGSQSNPKRPKYTHTWATIVKAAPEKSDSEKFDLTSHTISWLPSSLNVRVLALRPECGVNLSLKQTLNTVICNGECVAMWGPYEIDPTVAPQIYDKFLRQITRLNSGCVLYKAIDPDSGPKSKYISNCIHAVTDLDGLNRRGTYDEIRNNGFAASQYLAGVLIRSGKVDSAVTHEWVAEALDLNCYRIQRRMIIPCKPPVVVAPEVVVQPVVAPPQTVGAE